MSSRHRLAPQKIGSLIGAAFGLVFVLVNSSSVPPPAALAIRIMGMVAFLVVIVAVVRVPAANQQGGPEHPFSRAYWVVVAIEAAALIGGIRVLAGPLNMPQAGAAWVATVVGLHFFALARVWRLRLFDVLGIGLTACGVVGLVLAFLDADPLWIDLIAGVLSGAILLAFGLWGAFQGRPDAAR